jgi:diguanylate cyclase (GGDEF)-like protein/PAS domain S-box-containing protein
MHLQLHPYFIPLIIAALISGGIAATVWRWRSAPGAVLLSIHMFGVTLWSGASAAMWLSTSHFAQLFWLNLSALGILLIPPTFLLFGLQISHNKRLITRKLISVLSIVPLVGLSLIWTNDLHHLVYGSTQLWVTGGMAELRWSPGPFILFEAVYSYALMAVGIWFLARSMKAGGHLIRAQMKLVILGASLALFADVITLLPLFFSRHGLDPAPLVHTLAGGIYVYAIYRTKLLDIVPVVHSTLINSMTDGVVVLDEQDRIVEMNPAAGQFLGMAPRLASGCDAREILSTWHETTQPFWDQTEVHTQILVAQETPRTIDLIISPLLDGKKRIAGRMLVFRDITSQKQQEANLSNTNKLLNEQLDETRTLRDQLHEQATRDPLTNLYNRRYLEETLLKELARASRENYSICVIMMDIDRFKRVNDTCGHKVGDDVLLSLASLITLHIRRFDIACRYGGEEFVIVMPNLSNETARERAEFLRREFAGMPLPCANMKGRPTLSIGMASYPLDGFEIEELLNAADQALYAAKSAGRNRVVACSELTERNEAAEINTSKKPVQADQPARSRH